MIDITDDNNENLNENENNITNEEQEEVIKEEETKEDIKENKKDKKKKDSLEDDLIEMKNILDEKENELKESNDRYMRTLAEYDNFRKRTQKEKCDMYDKGIMDTVSNFLDIIDNFDRALQGINKDELDDKSKQVVSGIEMIRGQMDKALNKIGVTAIETKDKEFDPNIHNAVMHVEDESLGENMIAEELQRGYMYNDKVVRFSMVKVAN